MYALMGEGRGSVEGYVLYGRENVDNYGRPLAYFNFVSPSKNTFIVMFVGKHFKSILAVQ